MALTSIPHEVFIHVIIPNLPLPTIRVFRLVSVQAKAILDAAANTPYWDRTLANGERSYTPLTFSKYLQFLQRSRVIGRNPDLFVTIDRVRAQTKEAGKNPDEVKSLVRFGAKKDAFRSLVVFDYDSKQIKANGPKGLGSALVTAIFMDDHEMIEAIFLHPNVKNMQLHEDGILCCLGEAIVKKNQYAVEKILSLPCAKTLKAEALGQFMDQAIQVENAEALKTLFSLPNSSKMAIKYKYGLGEALINAAHRGNLEMINILIAHPNAAKIPTMYWDAVLERLNETDKKAVIEALESTLPTETLRQLQYVANLQSTSDSQ